MSKYWQKRFEMLEDARNKTAKGTVQAVTPAFDQAQAQIEKEINAWYARFAKNNEISLQEAKKLLNTRELKEFRWDVEEYIKWGRQNALDQQWMKQLENASARFHVSRLEALKIRTQNAAERAFGNELDQLDSMAARIYTDDYYHTAYELQKGLGIGFEVGQIDQRKLDAIVSKPWTMDKMTFSDRIWKAKTQLVDSLHKELTQMCVLGKAPDQVINNIANRMNVSKGQAGRLVMTEAAYFGSVAQKECFEDLDVEFYEIVATLDNRTSETCQQMDGKVFKMSDFQAGVTAPPFHVWCRSCTAPWFEDNDDGTRAARDAVSGKTYQVPASMKYDDWKAYFVDKTMDPADFLKFIDPDIVDIDALKKQLAGKEAELNDVKQKRIVKKHEQDDFLKVYDDPKYNEFKSLSTDELQEKLNLLREVDADLESEYKWITVDHDRYYARPKRNTPEREEWDKWHEQIKVKYGIENGGQLGDKLLEIYNEQRDVRMKIRKAETVSQWKFRFKDKTKQDFIDEIAKLDKLEQTLKDEIADLNRQIYGAMYDTKDLIQIRKEIIRKHEDILKTDIQKQEFSDIINGMTKEQANLYERMSVNFPANHYYQKGSGYYLPSDRCVYMDLDSTGWETAVGRTAHGAWKTKFHEELHQMDDILGWYQKSPFAQSIEDPTTYFTKITNPVSVAGSKMIQAIDEDVLNVINQAVDWKNATQGLNIKHVKTLNRISSDGKQAFLEWMMTNYPERKDKALISVFTDAVGLTTKGNLHPYSHGFWGHDKTYSKERGKHGATSEVWAELCSGLLRNDTEQIEAFTKLMPKTVKVYSDTLDEVMEWAKSGSFTYDRR